MLQHTLDIPLAYPRTNIPTSELENKFYDRMLSNPDLSRAIVSSQDNRSIPGFRWYRYREGFSWSLMQYLLSHVEHPTRLIDPFAGVGTAPFAATSFGGSGLGIEIMPVGAMVARAIRSGAKVKVGELRKAGNDLIRHVSSKKEPAQRDFLNHIRITAKAFKPRVERKIALARGFLRRLDNSPVADILSLACMGVLEPCSFTRKDGQFLRWDYRSGRDLRSKDFHKGNIPELEDALKNKLEEMIADIAQLKKMVKGNRVEVTQDTCLSRLRKLPKGEFDSAITSPPYANRYDYTRTYALELVWLGYGEKEVSELRQRLLSSTVENKPKTEFLSSFKKVFQQSKKVVEEQETLQKILTTLREHAANKELSNPHIIRLLENYFLEMAFTIFEMRRIMRSGGSWFMVNDNVQYSGIEIPVDLILSDIAEQMGFYCESIWVLPKGKGNASQQMGKYGRRELRKCVYHWKCD